MFSYYLILSAIVLINLFLGIFVLIKNPKKQVNLYLSLFILAIAGWNCSILLLQITQNQFFAKTAFFSASFIPVTLLYFASVFPSETKIKSTYKGLLFLPALLFSLISIFKSNFIFSNITFDNTSISYNNGMLHLPFVILFFSYFLASLIILFIKYQKSTGIKLSRLKYFFLGFFVSIFLASFVTLILPSLGYYQYNGLGPPLTSLVIITISYAIIRHRLMDLGMAVKKSSVYLLSILLTTTFSVLLFYLFFSVLFIPAKIAGPLVLILALFAFSFIKNISESLANKYLFVSTYNYQKAIENLTNQLVASINLEQINSTIINTIKESMKLEKAKLLLLENISGRKYFKLTGEHEDNEEKLLNEVIENHLSFYFNYFKFKQPLVYELIDELIIDPKNKKNIEIINHLVQMEIKLENLPIAVYLPLNHKGELIGVILLGEKISKDAFSKEDLNLLETLANQASISITNAKLYNEIQNLNKNLQDKVDEQTKHLKELLEMKSEFLTIASHQLRTPTSIIKGMLSTLLDQSINLDQNKKEDFIKKAYLGSQRLEKIVNDLLKASQLAAGKIEAERKPTQIGSIVEKILEERTPLIEKKKLELNYHKPQIIPNVFVDPVKIYDAISNLVDNAVNYTFQGKITVSIFEDADYLKLSIQDTGIGLTLQEKETICTKFKRGQKSFQINPNGSGLGLYIVKQILDANDSKIEILSDGENKGSTFNIYLPICNERDTMK